MYSDGVTRARDAAEVAFIVVVWAAVIAIVNPRGEFPLHDDWDFSVATFNFARTGEFRFTPFTAVSLRAQVLWGALWTRIAGQTFEALRLSTLILSAATLVVVNRILRLTALPVFARITATLALLAHPIFLWASCTFMTDVPFVFASSVAFYCFLRGLREERMAFVVVGCLAVVVAWFVRQNGVVALVPPLALIALDRRSRRFAIPILATLSLFAILFVFKREWLAGSPDMFSRHYKMLSESSFRTPEKITLVFQYFAFNALNVAAFFLPLTATLAWRRLSRQTRAVLAVVTVVMLARVVMLGLAGYWMPYDARAQYSNILPGPIVFNFGIGPPNLTDVFSMGYRYPFALEQWAAAVMTLAFACIAALVIVALIDAWRAATVEGRLAVGWITVASAALCLSGYYYDRYSLDSAWAAVIVLPLMIPWTRITRVVAIGLLVAIGFFSMMGVQEYFRWNRARWDMYRDLRARGIAIEQIDGGVEAWSFYELANADRKKAMRGHPPREYMIAFHPVPGYHVITSRPFSGFLGLRRGTVYTLQQDR